jgi:putative transposase
MDEKASFILEWESGESTVTALCESFGISRTLGYRYISRYLDFGRAGLMEQTRAPRRVWNRTDEDLVQAIVELRGGKPRLGALKLQTLLNEQLPDRKLPAVSTIELILKRHGLVKKRKRVRRIRETHPIFRAEGPNEIWSVDFKGEFRMGNMRYCYALTVMDTYSRYVLAVVGMQQPTYEGARAVVEGLFRQ